MILILDPNADSLGVCMTIVDIWGYHAVGAQTFDEAKFVLLNQSVQAVLIRGYRIICDFDVPTLAIGKMTPEEVRKWLRIMAQRKRGPKFKKDVCIIA